MFSRLLEGSSVVAVLRNIGERSTAKNYHPISLLSVVSKVFEKLVNNRIVNHLEKCSHFSDFQYGFRSSRSAADLLTVVSDKIAGTFNRSGATRAALDIFKAFDRVWHAGLLHELLKQVSDQISIFSPNDSPSKTMKNAFYFIKKAIFVLEIIKFFYFHPSLFFSLSAIASEDD